MADIGSDYTIRQEVMNLIHDLEPEDALRIAKSILDTLPVAVRIFERDDVLSQIDEYYPDHTLSDEDKSDIVDVVVESYGWRTVLPSADEDDWDTINGEIQDAARSLGLRNALER